MNKNNIKNLETNRLIIRRTQKEDTDFCMSVWLDEEMGRFLSDPPREKASDIYSKWRENIETDTGCYYFVAVSKEDGSYVGTCSTVPSRDKKHWDLGYAIHKKYWRQGYATEMIKALCDFCIENGAVYITADVAKLNMGSNRVLKKLGFQVEKEGSFKKSGTDIVYEDYTYRLDVPINDFERTFENDATNYEISRPVYVKELYREIFNYKQIDSSSKVLEIGIGTGKATLPILEKECALIALEPGEQLAYITNEKFKKYNNITMYNQTLQDFTYPVGSFDFIYSATAFHWIPEEYGYKRVYELLKDGGAFARFAYHAGADRIRDSLSLEIDEIYKKYFNTKDNTKDYCEDDAKKTAEIAEKYGFVDVKYSLFHMTKDFTADEYMGLLKTYPDHMKIEKNTREKLFNEIHAAINKNGRVITVYYTIDLEMARKHSNKGEEVYKENKQTLL